METLDEGSTSHLVSLLLHTVLYKPFSNTHISPLAEVCSGETFFCQQVDYPKPHHLHGLIMAIRCWPWNMEIDLWAGFTWLWVSV